MATNDRQRQFDQIVARLTADYPSLAVRPRRPRRVQVTLAVVGGLAWGLLSVAMVAWGARGILLTCVSVALAGIVAAWDDHRRRHGRSVGRLRRWPKKAPSPPS
jgi:hypothetical protein